jgi:hypothetical protein
MVFRVAGRAGPAAGYAGYYGSFYSTQDQSDGIDTPTPMTVNNTAEAAGVSVANNLSGNPSRVTFAYAGTYNIQFSAQLHNTGGGGSGQTVNIWFRLNGINIPNSDTKVTVNTNNPYFVAAWNFIQTVSANDYIEMIFKTDNANIVFEYEAATVNSPAIPSVIITAQQIR